MAERKARSGEGASLVASLVIIGLIAIGVGVLMGNYAIKMFTRPPAEPGSSAVVGDTSKTGEDLGALTQGGSTSAPSSKASSSAGEGGGAAAPQVSGTVFRVQVGAFGEKANAEKLKDELAQQGYEAIVSATAPYRVQVGTFTSEENAKKMAEELEAKGYPVYVPRD